MTKNRRIDRMTQHDTCQWPPKEPCMYDFRPGVRCAPIKEEYRLEHDLPQKPDFAVDHKEPIVVEWPPKQPHIGQGDDASCQPDTGIREDLLNKIPDSSQIIPQVITVHGTQQALPTQLVAAQLPIRHAERPHPLCPDGEFHMEIRPPQPIKPEIRIPDLGNPVRQPMRCWKQCIENTLINDRVRRPMARWCHKRPLPPLVLPTCELQRLKDKCTEPERKVKEREERVKKRECQRLESRRRMAQWNYTVESLLDRKREKEDAKERAEQESLQKLLVDIKNGRDSHSEEQIARANKLQLYRKGLIKDFHSKMAFSKMIQDIDRMRQKDANEEERLLEKTLPICDTKCMKAMLRDNDRPEYPKRGDKPKRINEKLLKTLKSIENRQQEQKGELNAQVQATKQMLKDNLPELPPAYLKLIKEPTCDVNETSSDKFVKAREQLYDDIDTRLAIDAFIESTENEVERQACEYRKYKIHKDKIRKDLEERLIKEKVQRNIAKSEAAARVLVEMRKEKQKRANEYDSLKDKWESEMQDKEDEKKEQHQKLMDKVIKDFWERKGVEKCKLQMRDVSRLWAKERLVAEENYEQECQRKNVRRQEAEEIQLYNLALASEKKCQQEREKMIENAWAEKVKSQYFEEIQEMKDYAQDCIRDWIGKGRNPLPMQVAMKKWEHDSAMDPRMFRNYEEKKRLERGDADRGAGDADGYALLLNSHNYIKKNDNPNKTTTQDTSRRLGFC